MPTDHPLAYAKYPYTPVLGWSMSRYEVFDKCKRQYFYAYYGKHATHVPQYKLRQLKDLTSVPLETGNVVHDVVEAFLKRLQKDDSRIDEGRFFAYAREKTREYFSRKTFMEVYYKTAESIDVDRALARVEECFRNFLSSSCCSWICMKAITNRDNWMIEPEGYGETRIDGMKAYCKMDFLFPVDGEVHILDWKTGRKDTYKHSQQLVGYALAASANFGIPSDRIFPKIVYLHPAAEEFSLALREADLDRLRASVKAQTQEMRGLCRDADQNLPLDIERFPLNPSPPVCAHCNYWELCFPGQAKNAEVRMQN